MQACSGARGVGSKHHLICSVRQTYITRYRLVKSGGIIIVTCRPFSFFAPNSQPRPRTHEIKSGHPCDARADPARLAGQIRSLRAELAALARTVRADGRDAEQMETTEV